MEPPSSRAPAAAAVAKAGALPAKAASPRPAQKRAAEDAAASGRPRAERPLPALTDQRHAKRRRLDSSGERSDVCNVCTCRRFLKKLWDIVESELFSSVWWSDNGQSVVIHEEKFKEEVLSRRCCMKIFHSESMESFSWQLHLYGFTKEPQDLPRSGSLDDSAFAASAGEFSCYYHPYFRRHGLHLLMKFNPSFVRRKPAPAGPPPEMDWQAHQQKTEADLALACETAAPSVPRPPQGQTATAPQPDGYFLFQAEEGHVVALDPHPGSH